MSTKQNRALGVAAASAAALWVATGAVSAAVSWNSILGGGVGGVLPPTVHLSVWTQPQPWPVLTALLGALTIAVLHRLVTRMVPLPDARRAAYVIVWFASVVAGGVTGFATDIATIVSSLPVARLQMLVDNVGVNAGVGAHWGLLYGWFPGLLVVAMTRHAPLVDESVTHRATWSRATFVLALGATIALVAVTVTGALGQRAAHTTAVRNEAVANGFDEGSGALPDPYAEGDPVPTIAPASRQPEPEWCTSDQAMLLLGDPDAATGHRSLSVTVMNFSDSPCVVEGYPDFAFADQNGNALNIDLKQGSSFMTTDPGARRVEIPAGESAITHLGWDANPTQDALIASTLYAAPYAGETRGSWPVQTDITEGSTVEVTAWSLLSTAVTTAP